ncbi:hypothetical protein LIS77_14405 [Cytobacillus firmus]|uniref:DNA modification system-associated small protein n=1 Tax=Cytobacillus TaxID=2675230 RepID=UPI00207A321F|nr:DNA modification system-associated small protein [Cytobacillus firmus]USK37130.1 hypothetical protein LIS77_14405 [Cytobacillus firmus]
MHKEEEKLIEEICKKYDLEKEYFEKLFKLEKDYANKNMGRRVGIFKDIKEMLAFWSGSY